MFSTRLSTKPYRLAQGHPPALSKAPWPPSSCEPFKPRPFASRTDDRRLDRNQLKWVPLCCGIPQSLLFLLKILNVGLHSFGQTNALHDSLGFATATLQDHGETDLPISNKMTAVSPKTSKSNGTATSLKKCTPTQHQPK